jgi:hypothetical protein
MLASLAWDLKVLLNIWDIKKKSLQERCASPSEANG